MAQKKIAFILSTGRTGTKAIAEGLIGDDILSPHQPPYSRLLTIASNYYLHSWISRSFLKWLVYQLRWPQIKQAQARYYIQVFSLDHLPAKLIAEQHPNVYIIHIVRDPRTFVPSYLNWVHGRFKSYIANKFVFGWHPSGYFTGKVPWRTWLKMDEFQRVCWHWVYKNQNLESFFANSPHYLCLRFEELFSAEKGQETVELLTSFIGIPYQNRFETIYKQAKNSSLKTHFPQWAEWPEERKRQLMDICSQQMEHYGYQTQEWIS